MSKINSKDISVVVQGAIDYEYTPNCLKSIRKYLPNAEIILSTWKGSNVDGLEYDEVVFNDDINCGFSNLSCTKKNNLNRMLLTTKAGISKASKKYILKLRSDIELKNVNFLNYYNSFCNIKNNQKKIFNQKVIIPTIFTRKFVGKDTGSFYTPFHISDWFQFGLREDIAKIWSCPLVKEPEFSDFFRDKPIRQKYLFNDRTWKFPPEQYIGYSLFKSFDNNIKMEHMLDYNDIILKLSDSYIKANFIVLRPSDIRIQNKKYPIYELQDEDESSIGGYVTPDDYLIKKLFRFIYHKYKFFDKRIIVFCGIKFSYKNEKEKIIKRFFDFLREKLDIDLIIKENNILIDELQNKIKAQEEEINQLYQTKMDYLFDKIQNERLNNPIDINNLFENSKYIVDQSLSGNEKWDMYKKYLFKNDNVYHSFNYGLDKADTITLTGRHFPKIKTFLIEQALNRNLPILFEENGYIRSITSYAQFLNGSDDEKYAAAISYCFDDLSYFFDATRPTRIEVLLNSELKLTNDQLNYARKMIDKIVNNNISKYNYQPIKKINIGDPNRKKVLVMEQSKGDFSIIKGFGDENTFNYMLECAINENPNCDILVKVHPDTLANGNKKAYCDIKNNANVYQLSELINPISLIKQVDKVYVVSTQAGFEALMCNKEVHTFGMPFYAGWGLTIDQKHCHRRTRKRSLEEIFYIFYCMYTNYINPDTKHRCSLDEAIDWIIKERDKYFNGGKTNEICNNNTNI